MIVDYNGHIIRKSSHVSNGYVCGEINIKGLREHRAYTDRGSKLAYMRSGLWKQIYERWPDYPKNSYLQKDIPRAIDRSTLLSEAKEELFKAGIYTAPGK